MNLREFVWLIKIISQEVTHEEYLDPKTKLMEGLGLVTLVVHGGKFELTEKGRELVLSIKNILVHIE